MNPLPMRCLSIDTDRFAKRFEEFSAIGATDDGGVNRPALSPANKRARDTLIEWFQSAGLDIRIDTMGNIFGRRAGTDPDAPAVMTGSHIDSQYNGGRYDGVIGVLGGLEVLETLQDENVNHKRPIEVVAWSNEEGVRFQPDMLGSGVYCGVFDEDYAYDRTDDDGVAFGDALSAIGYDGDVPCSANDIHSYFELHVEQGPYLEREDRSVAAVTGVFGFSWLTVTLTGLANHAGPTPMTMRRDPLAAFASITDRLRSITATAGSDLVATVGSVDVWPNAINVIPETVEFTVDLRSYDDSVVDDAVAQLRAEIAHAANREGVEFTTEEIMRVDADPFDQSCIDTVTNAMERLDCDYTTLVSGAGHDANYLNTIAPTSMIFVPSVDGVSHRESEFTEWSDVVTGTNVLAETLRQRATE